MSSLFLNRRRQVMSNQSLNVRLQNLRNFTVQIRNATNAIVGTGFVVSTDGKIVNCLHVVREAIGVHPRDAGDKLVGVYFPKASDEATKLQSAKVVAYFPQHADDVVLLQLVGDSVTLSPDQVAILGRAEDSFD